MEDKVIVVLLWSGGSLLILVLSIPLILKKIPPNLFYGFRIKKALSNNEIWYKTNIFFGKSLLTVSLIGLIGSLVLFFTRDNLSPDLICWIAAVIIIFPLLISTVLSFSYVRRISITLSEIMGKKTNFYFTQRKKCNG